MRPITERPERGAIQPRSFRGLPPSQTGCFAPDSRVMDKLSPERRSQNMSRIRGRDTKPELLARRAAHALGYRYRLHDKSLPGSPDLVFPGRKIALFVH